MIEGSYADSDEEEEAELIDVESDSIVDENIAALSVVVLDVGVDVLLDGVGGRAGRFCGVDGGRRGDWDPGEA